jgi:hypothetical protein
MFGRHHHVRSLCLTASIIGGVCAALLGCTPFGSPTPDAFILRTTAPLPDPVAPTPDPLPSQIIRLDETWYQYINDRFGFLINFPQAAISPYGVCAWVEENGDHSYRPEPAHVALKVFEDGNTTYIAREYYQLLTGETKEPSGDGATRSFFSECRTIMNDLEALRNPDSSSQTAWRIVASDVHDDAELDAFLKSQYGSGCSLGEKVVSSQEGVYDIRIQGDGKDLGGTQCPLNRVIVVKYYPAGSRVVTWDRGQAPTFAADTAYSRLYDQEMVNSFQFLIEAPTAEQAVPESCQVWGHDTCTDRDNLISPEEAGPGRPMPPLSNELAYTRVEIAEAGLSVDVPAGWLRLEPAWAWTPSEGSALFVGIAWAELQPGQEAEAAMLPASAVVLHGEPLAVDWGNGQLFTVAVYGEQPALQAVEMHALIVVVEGPVRRAFDLYLVAPDAAQAVGQQVILQRLLETAVLSR